MCFDKKPGCTRAHEGSEICGQIWENDRYGGLHFIVLLFCCLEVLGSSQIKYFLVTSQKCFIIISTRQNDSTFVS